VIGRLRVVGIVIPGQQQYVLRRGHPPEAVQDVFFIDDDRRAYLEFLRERFGFNAADSCLT